MDIIEVVGVMTKALENFYLGLTYLDVLIVAGIFIGAVTLLSIAHILFGAKAKSARRARGIARYFERVYIGSYLDARRFLRKRWYLLSRHARREFEAFASGSNNLASSDFALEVMRPGKGGLGLVMSTYSIAIIVTIAFIGIKAYVEMLDGLECILFLTVPLVALLIVKGMLFAMVRMVNKGYVKAEKRLWRAIPSVRYNNEYMDAILPREIDESADFLRCDSEESSKTEEVIRRMQETESTLNGDSEQQLLECIENIKSSLSPEDRAKYDEFLNAREREAN